MIRYGGCWREQVRCRQVTTRSVSADPLWLIAGLGCGETAHAHNRRAAQIHAA